MNKKGLINAYKYLSPLELLVSIGSTIVLFLVVFLSIKALASGESTSEVLIYVFVALAMLFLETQISLKGVRRGLSSIPKEQITLGSLQQERYLEDLGRVTNSASKSLSTSVIVTLIIVGVGVIAMFLMVILLS